MHHLTSLELCLHCNETNQGFAQCMLTLTTLRSLTLTGMTHSAVSAEIVDRLTALEQLRRLSLSETLRECRLRFPTGIVDLALDSHHGFHSDLPRVLSSMLNLTCLRIINASELPLFRSGRTQPSCLFQRLEKLRTLVTWNVILDQPSLDVLATLSGLTELRFTECEAQVESCRFSTQLGRFPNLKVVELPFVPRLVDCEVDLLRQNSCGLREMHVPRSCFLSAEARAALFRAFPCLRRIL